MDWSRIHSLTLPASILTWFRFKVPPSRLPLPYLTHRRVGIALVQPPPIESNDDSAAAKSLVEACHKIRQQVGRVVVGQDEVIEQLLIAILARGHCLLEGVPGLAKTLMVHTLADSMDLSFRRIQFTPDLMPGDITGTEIIQEDPQSGHRKFVFERGPVFTQMLLADEINRTPPKTQAALLEAMQEHAVTAAGKTYPLDEPFFVAPRSFRIEQLDVAGGFPTKSREGRRKLIVLSLIPTTNNEQRWHGSSERKRKQGGGSRSPQHKAADGRQTGGEQL